MKNRFGRWASKASKVMEDPRWNAVCHVLEHCSVRKMQTKVQFEGTALHSPRQLKAV